MFSLQNILSRDALFYDLLEASAAQARKSIQALTRVLEAPQQLPRLQEFHEPKEANRRTTEQINEALAHAFVTQLDREDIEVLSAVLYKIPKTVEKFAERFIVSGGLAKDADFSRHIRLLDEATNHVFEMVRQLRLRPSVEEIKEVNSVLQRMEGEAGKLILELFADLYNNAHPSNKVLAMKDLYELLEKIIERCRDAGNIVTHIVIKHS